MGVYSGTGVNLKLQNGSPNTLNLIIWHTGFDVLSKQLASLCTPEPGTIVSKVNDNFLQKIKVICKWPASEAKVDQSLEEFWQTVMLFDADEEEFIVWKEFFQKYYSQVPAVETVAAMLRAMFMNPHFLLQK